MNCELNAEDRKVYFTWLQRTVLAYGAVVLLGVAVVAIQASTHTINIAEFATTAVSLAGP